MANKTTQILGIEPWFLKPQGRDIPSSVQDTSTAYKYHLTIKERVLKVVMRLILDSQQPQIKLFVPDQKGCCIVFPLQNCDLNCGFQGETREINEYINEKRSRYTFLKEMPTVHVFQLVPTAEPVIIWNASQRNNDDSKQLCALQWTNTTFSLWGPYNPNMTVLVTRMQWLRLLHRHLGQRMADGEREAFWWYRCNPQSTQDEYAPAPSPPWLFAPQTSDGKQAFVEWAVNVPYFIDDHDRRCRLLEASRKERDFQRQQVVNIYNPKRLHRAQIVSTPGRSYTHYMHVRLGETVNDSEAHAPKIMAGTEVKFTIAAYGQKCELAHLGCRGEVVDVETDCDIVIQVGNPIPPAYKDGSQIVIATSIEPNLLPINEQIDALNQITYANVFGDREENWVNGHRGYSLKRLVLAHGSELDPSNEHYFVLNAQSISPVPVEAQHERLTYILKHFPLDRDQRMAYEAATMAITCGIQLIQGPPGTGKTRTSLVIILALAALNLPVMIAAGSNKGVDNLAIAVAEALNEHEKLRNWIGSFYRVRTSARQISEVRNQSADYRRRPRPDASRSEVLEPYEMHNNVLKYVQEFRADSKDNETFLELVALDRQRPLTGDGLKAMKKTYRKVSGTLLEGAKIVATTLSNAANEVLRHAFQPVFLVSDESGQCMEGDHAIALTQESLRAVVLVGDPKQLPPTVMSRNQQNEGAVFLGRSLMERLQAANYPCTMLRNNYRNHPHIIDFFNRYIYQGQLMDQFNVTQATRVGYVWDHFTRSHHYFRANGLEGVRFLFISENGFAEQEKGSTSWINRHQVQVLSELLNAVLRFKAPNGAMIQAKDIMIISPYRDQRILVRSKLSVTSIRVHDNLTVDAAQGQEAPLVIFLMTKPSVNTLSVGFIADANRLNVALSRAKEVHITLGNLAAWNPDTLGKISHMRRQNSLLVNFLKQVSAKGQTLTWNGPRTVNETLAPKHTKYDHHDKRVRKQRPVAVLPPPVAPVAGLVPATPSQVAHASTVSLSSASAHVGPATGAQVSRPRESGAFVAQQQHRQQPSSGAFSGFPKAAAWNKFASTESSERVQPHPRQSSVPKPQKQPLNAPPKPAVPKPTDPKPALPTPAASRPVVSPPADSEPVASASAAPVDTRTNSQNKSVEIRKKLLDFRKRKYQLRKALLNLEKESQEYKRMEVRFEEIEIEEEEFQLQLEELNIFV